MNIIEITNAYDSAEQALADWSFATDPQVLGVIERAARSIARKYEDNRTTEFDDAYQEGLVLVATRRDLQEAVARIADEPGLLHTRLVRDLTDKYKREAEKRVPSRLTSWELNNDKLAAQGY
ncbi:hypothetical protein KGG70_gp35 [Streptomyces phage Celia]|uniref:Uncharacterized protein n=1 Tax=Streptomyces phage Celia TaxID=2590946 RepID=A0A516KRD8_9CAUD|nr:hypothetical protein KGG70_gp35 [Streptomyces phage Celia]QDP44249.1 hypothetical protein SEA_CELIA_46 [Streptomyces phage Celia]QFG10509.1 hypothetical protein SEA_URZA_46 [Streptomyces phage Urza]QJD50611.1 hypothetical protein SEA_ITZA_46 [Streptomyces phage Itza]